MPITYPQEVKVAAVAQVKAGETPAHVARRTGCAHKTLSAWIVAAERQGTPHEKALAERSDVLADRLRVEIQDRIPKIATDLLDGIEAVIPKAIERGSLQALATSLGIVLDKDLKLAEAEAKAKTQGTVDGLPEDLDQETLVARIEKLRAARDGRN
ncbi:MAG TPA: transposase [Gemmatimonadales bacterium]|nr:transposase [Gemmatimonadales bacterium]